MFTKAYLHTIVTRQEVAAHLLSKHNINFNLSLMRKVQAAITNKTLKEFAYQFVNDWYKQNEEEPRPDYVDYALKLAFDTPMEDL